MITLFNIGFTQKTAEEFFEKLRVNKIECLIDIRLNNKSQLAGFAKGADLSYFLKEICGCGYSHEIAFAQEIITVETDEEIQTINPGKKGQQVKLYIPFDNVLPGTIIRRKK